MSPAASTARVSVVIPAYNAERYIARAVDSVLSQSHRVHELIVVDDGSDDTTGAILAGYGDRIRVIRTANGGVARARNTGLAQTTGELVALLDADDVWRPQKLARQLDVLAAHEDVEFTCSNFLARDVVSDTSTEQFGYVAQRHGAFFDRVLPHPLARLFLVNFVGTCSNVLFTKALWDRVGPFDVELRQAEDFDMWLRMATETGFYLQSEVLVEKILHGQNLTSRFDETLRYHEAVVLAFRSDHAELFTADPELAPAFDRGLADVRYKLAGILFTQGRRSDAFGYLRRSWTTDRSPRNRARIARRGLRRLLAPSR